MNFALTVTFMVLVYAIGATGAVWLSRYCGLTSIAHAAIIGTGAYSYAIAGTMFSHGSSMVSLAISGLLGAFVVLLSERVVGDDFALATFGIQTIWLSYIKNGGGFTGGALGISNVERLLPQDSLGAPAIHCISAGLFLALVLRAISLVDRSAFWAGAACVKRSRELARTIGLSSVLIRLQVGAVYGLTLGAMGISMASFLTFIGPDQFTSSLSVAVLAISFIDTGRLRYGGVLLGSLLVAGGPQIIRVFGISSAKAGFYQLLFGGVIVMMVPLFTLRSFGLHNYDKAKS